MTKSRFSKFFIAIDLILHAGNLQMAEERCRLEAWGVKCCQFVRTQVSEIRKTYVYFITSWTVMLLDHLCETHSPGKIFPYKAFSNQAAWRLNQQLKYHYINKWNFVKRKCKILKLFYVSE